jgi:hypothetical protein
MLKHFAHLYFQVGCLVLLIVLTSCNELDNDTIYKPGRLWNYKVSIADSSGIVIDTFLLNMSTRKSSVAEKIIRPITVCYEYIERDSLVNRECTGVRDDKNSVSLHPPREHKLEFTEVLPFPSASKQFKSNSWEWYKAEVDINIQKASYFDKSINKSVDLAGMKIKQELWITDTLTLSYKDNNYLCYIIEGKNTSHTSELGEFKCKYFFNNELGFIKLIYVTPWEETYELILINHLF